MKFNFLHLFKILAIEIAYFFFIELGYAVFSMLAFGEGANSFMYSQENQIIYFILLFFPQSIFNMLKAKKYWNNSRIKSINYIITQIVFFIMIGFFVVSSYY